MTDIGPMNARKLIKAKLDNTLTDMNLVGQEKNDTHVSNGVKMAPFSTENNRMFLVHFCDTFF